MPGFEGGTQGKSAWGVTMEEGRGEEGEAGVKFAFLSLLSVEWVAVPWEVGRVGGVVPGGSRGLLWMDVRKGVRMAFQPACS